MRHAVIMAGGAGTRLWPLSRRERPKHFIQLLEGRSLMRTAFERLAACMDPAQINVVTSQRHLDLVAEELPELPADNLIGEPAVRDTANAVGLAAVILQQRDADGTMGMFTADHIIKPIETFKSCLDRAYAAAEANPDALVTLGVKPRSPHTGYGYVRRGDRISDGTYVAAEFKEKPDRPTAERYVNSGEYYWNSGMFVWRISAILNEFKQHLPDNYAALSKVGLAGSLNERTAAINAVFPNLNKISIDYGVMEKAARVLTCELDCEWLDVGAWTSLGEVLQPDGDGNILSHRRVVAMDSKNNIFVGEDDHLIATIGLEDVVIVRSENATLVCKRQDVQKIKDLVGKLDEDYL